MAGILTAMTGINVGDAARVTVVGATEVDGPRLSPIDSYAGYRLTSSGNEQSGVGTSGPAYSTIQTWLKSGANSDYEVRATLNSGAVQSGTTGSWLALTSDRAWECIVTGLGTATANLTIEVRDDTTLEVLDSATVDLTAEVEL